MLSVNDMFYNEKQEPVLVYGQADRSRSQFRKGYLSRQDSRNFRSSASPPPSRTNHHASSWFGHRKSSQSPPHSRHHAYESSYADYRSSKYGRSPERKSSWFGHRRKDSESPPRSSYHESQEHTKYKEDYTGYPLESGYTAENGYGDDYRSPRDHGYSRQSYSSSGHGYSSGPRYVSSDMYHGHHSATVPRTYQSAYGAANYSGAYAEVVKLKVDLCCEACEERITNHMLALEGVESVTCDQVKQKVTVRGTASPADVLRQGKECFKNTKFWRG